VGHINVMRNKKKVVSSLKNHFLLAMPGLNDPQFSQSVVYICDHSQDGDMGLIVNQQMNIPAKAIFKQLGLEFDLECGNQLIFDGGPVAKDRGFILHRISTLPWESTVSISDDICLTASKDILGDIAKGKGPSNALITLGYSSWDAGQLEEELTTNSWLTIPADSSIIFNTACHERAHAAASLIGLDLGMLSSDMGHA
jgi:putative transcriptional regulator